MEWIAWRTGEQARRTFLVHALQTLSRVSRLRHEWRAQNGQQRLYGLHFTFLSLQLSHGCPESVRLHLSCLIHVHAIPLCQKYPLGDTVMCQMWTSTLHNHKVFFAWFSSTLLHIATLFSQWPISQCHDRKIKTGWLSASPASYVGSLAQ